ncbi:hypothetical protein D3C84_898630 [compost metagenome]
MHRDPDVRLQSAVHHTLAQAHAVTGDDPGLFQARQPRRHGGAGNAQLPGEHGHAFTGIDLQGRDQLAVDFVKDGGADVRQGRAPAAQSNGRACYRHISSPGCLI